MYIYMPCLWTLMRSKRIELKLDAPVSEAGLLGRQAAHQALEQGAKSIIDALPKEKRLH